ELYPSYRMFKLDEGLFNVEYRAKITRTRDEILRKVEELEEAYAPRDLYFLCFEDLRNGTTFCHRRVFAAWYQELTGVEIPDIELVLNEQVEQLTLDGVEPTRPSEDQRPAGSDDQQQDAAPKRVAEDHGGIGTVS